MATTWDYFEPWIDLSAEGVPSPLAQDAVARAAIDFCVRSRVWRDTLDDVTIAAGSGNFDITPPDGTRVVRIEGASLGGTELEFKSVDDLRAIYDDWTTETGTPLYVTQRTPTAGILVPEPTAAGTLSLSASLAPANDATGMDEAIAERYRDALVSGALAIILLVPNKPFTQPQLAAFHKSTFDRAVWAAAQEADKAFGRARLAVRPVGDVE